MNNEKINQIIDEVYKRYTDKYVGYEDAPNKELFVHEIKTNPEFSERWGLKIEERELSLEERYDLIEKDKHKQFVTWQSHGTDRIKEIIDEQEVPTKLITITYNNTKTDVYE